MTENQVLYRHHQLVTDERFAGAEEILVTAIELHPDYCAARDLLITFYERGPIRKARKEMTQLLVEQVRACPDDQDALKKIIRDCLTRASGSDDAVESYYEARLACTAVALSRGLSEGEAFEAALHSWLERNTFEDPRTPAELRASFITAGYLVLDPKSPEKLRQLAAGRLLQESIKYIPHHPEAGWADSFKVYQRLLTEALASFSKGGEWDEQSATLHLMLFAVGSSKAEAERVIGGDYVAGDYARILALKDEFLTDFRGITYWLGIYFKGSEMGGDAKAWGEAHREHVEDLLEGWVGRAEDLKSAEQVLQGVIDFGRAHDQQIREDALAESFERTIADAKKQQTLLDELTATKREIDLVQNSRRAKQLEERASEGVDRAIWQSWKDEFARLKTQAAARYTELDMREKQADHEEFERAKKENEEAAKNVVSTALRATDYYQQRALWAGEPKVIKGLRQLKISRTTVTGSNAEIVLDVEWTDDEQRKMSGRFYAYLQKINGSWIIQDLTGEPKYDEQP